MIKSGMQISEAAMNPPVQLHKNLNTNLPKDESKIEIPMVAKSDDRLSVNNHFARLKKRMRGRSNSIF